MRPRIGSRYSIFCRVLSAQEIHSTRAREVFSTGREPSGDADKSNDANSRAGVIHRVLSNRVCAGEIECYRSENQEQESQDVEPDGHRN